jgi:hypothetical protein
MDLVVVTLVNPIQIRDAGDINQNLGGADPPLDFHQQVGAPGDEPGLALMGRQKL